jgi:hypothetical protein
VRFLQQVRGGCILAAMLAGCSAQQAPLPVGGIATQSSPASSTNAGDLIYVLSARRESGGWILAYPSGQLVDVFGFPSSHFFGRGLCSDAKGNVFAVVGGVTENYVYEYAHGGRLPIATLFTPWSPVDCSVDPSSGDLAVVSYPTSSYETGIAIYRNAQGKPSFYTDSSFGAIVSCSYDAAGNLYVAGRPPRGAAVLVAELPKGSRRFAKISLSTKLVDAGEIRRDGADLTLRAQTPSTNSRGHYAIFRLRVEGSRAAVLGSTRFFEWRRPWSWTIFGDALIGVHGEKAHSIGYWRYPKGGRAYRIVKGFADTRLGALTISRAPR